MISQQVISITDLRVNTAQVLNALHGIKYVFVNNKPKTVIMDISSYEALQKKLQQHELLEEVRQTEKNGPRFRDSKSLMKDLLS